MESQDINDTHTPPAPANARPAMPPVGAVLPFVVLHHTGYRAEHYDLLLAPGAGSTEPLLTWAILNSPAHWPARGIAGAQRLPDHRAFYLTYEGDISGNRGSVNRVAQGLAQIIAVTDQWIDIALDTPPARLRLPAT